MSRGLLPCNVFLPGSMMFYIKILQVSAQLVIQWILTKRGFKTEFQAA